MSALNDCIAAVTEAGAQRDRANADAVRRRDKAVAEAEAELAAALDRHDATEAAADAQRQATTEAAAAAYRDAVAKAEAALDAAKQAEHDAPDVRIEQADSGTLFLKSGRQTLGSATPSHGGHWRLNSLSGIAFVPDRLQARAALWDVLTEATDLTGALQAHPHRPELAAAPRR